MTHSFFFSLSFLSQQLFCPLYFLQLNISERRLHWVIKLNSAFIYYMLEFLQLLFHILLFLLFVLLNIVCIWSCRHSLLQIHFLFKLIFNLIQDLVNKLYLLLACLLNIFSLVFNLLLLLLFMLFFLQLLWVYSIPLIFKHFIEFESLRRFFTILELNHCYHCISYSLFFLRIKELKVNSIELFCSYLIWKRHFIRKLVLLLGLESNVKGDIWIFLGVVFY